jgi:hypothetical protein
MPRKQTPSHGYRERKVNIRELRQRFLIVCEGAKTEPNYFKRFRVPKTVIEVVGVAANPSKLVQITQDLQGQDDYDQIWCVFDRDDWTKADFNQALQAADNQGFQVAYSNEAFELWYVLHFEFLNTGIPRKDYVKKLTVMMDKPYQKNSSTIYDDLLERQEVAIRNARQLLQQYKLPNPIVDNPSTTVHLLVAELNRFAV